MNRMDRKRSHTASPGPPPKRKKLSAVSYYLELMSKPFKRFFWGREEEEEEENDEETEEENDVQVIVPQQAQAPPVAIQVPPVVRLDSPDDEEDMIEISVFPSDVPSSRSSPSSSSSLHLDATQTSPSPKPEDSISRQHTPCGFYTNAYKKSDHWSRTRRAREPTSPLIMARKASRIIQKEQERQNSNPVNLNARDAYAAMVSRLGGHYIEYDSSSTLTSQRSSSRYGKRLKRLCDSQKERILDKVNSIIPNEANSRRSSLRSASSVTPYFTPRHSKSPSRTPLSSNWTEKLDDITQRINQVDIKKTEIRFNDDRLKEGLRLANERAALLHEEDALRAAARLDAEKKKQITIREKLELQGIHVPQPKKVENEFPQLTEEMLALSERVWGGGNPEEKFAVGYDNTPLLRKDLKTLCGLDWLNDEVINSYLALVCARPTAENNLPKTYAFSTFFYASLFSKGFAAVKRWTRKVDIFSFDVLLVPIHLKMHWCMAVIDLGEHRIDYYDSLGGNNNECLEILKKYIVSESMDKKNIPFKFDDSWKFTIRKDIPRQKNGSDCGVFSCKFADFAARRKPISFDQSHMPYYRKRMVYQLVKNKL